jgi:hypothetical protein
MVGTVVGGANFADTTYKYSKGTASGKDLALSALGIAPTAAIGVKGVAARRSAYMNAKAARTAADRVEDLTANAASIKQEADAIARVAPGVNAPKAARAAAETGERVGGTLRSLEDMGTRMSRTTRAVGRTDAISASRLRDQADEVIASTSSARAHASELEQLVPDALTPAAQAAKERLAYVERVAADVKRNVEWLAVKQQSADRVADQAERVKDALGTTALHAGNVNNATKSVRERSDQGWSLTDGSLARGVVTWGLNRNARPVTAGA